jgi:hypothetical protein
MHELVEKLEKEKGVKVEQFETWHDETNARKLEDVDRGFCGGVPFFYNTESKKWICGEDSYEALVKWAEGK